MPLPLDFDLIRRGDVRDVNDTTGRNVTGMVMSSTSHREVVAVRFPGGRQLISISSIHVYIDLKNQLFNTSSKKG